MYNNVYQDYINNMIGMTPRAQSDFEYQNMNYFHNQINTNMDLERFYPELYRLLYPMVQTACMRNTKPITEETINEMVNEIYSNFNADDVTILNINLNNDVRSSNKSNEQAKTSNVKSSSKTLTETRNQEGEDRNLRPRNFILNDLIRILIIRELLGRPGSFPPNRPGFLGSGGGRPPFRPRDLNYSSQDFSIYEEPNMYSDFR